MEKLFSKMPMVTMELEEWLISLRGAEFKRLEVDGHLFLHAAKANQLYYAGPMKAAAPAGLITMGLNFDFDPKVEKVKLFVNGVRRPNFWSRLESWFPCRLTKRLHEIYNARKMRGMRF